MMPRILATGEVLEIILRLPEIKVQHELDRLCIAQRDESFTPAAIIMCCFEGDVCEKIFDQFRLNWTKRSEYR